MGKHAGISPSLLVPALPCFSVPFPVTPPPLSGCCYLDVVLLLFCFVFLVTTIKLISLHPTKGHKVTPSRAAMQMGITQRPGRASTTVGLYCPATTSLWDSEKRGLWTSQCPSPSLCDQWALSFGYKDPQRWKRGIQGTRTLICHFFAPTWTYHLAFRASVSPSGN